MHVEITLVYFNWESDWPTPEEAANALEQSFQASVVCDMDGAPFPTPTEILYGSQDQAHTRQDEAHQVRRTT